MEWVAEKAVSALSLEGFTRMRGQECLAFRSPLFPKIPESGILSSPDLSTPPCLILPRPTTSSSSEAMSPTPLGLLVARPQRSRGRGPESHEGHCLLQRRRRKQRPLIRPRIRRTPSLVKNVAGKRCLLAGSVLVDGRRAGGGGGSLSSRLVF